MASTTLRCGRLLVRPAAAAATTTTTTTTKPSPLVQHAATSLFSHFLLVPKTKTTRPSAAAVFSTPNASTRRLFGTSAPRPAPGLPRQGTPREADGTPSAEPIPTMSSRDPRVPAYPYGERQFYKQSNRGLYGNARIRFGNNVSEKHNVKTTRKWKPNVRRRRLWSEALRCMVQTRVTTRVLRTIDRCGGLDNYLLGEKPARKKELGPWGWKLRWRLMQTDVVQERFRQQRIAFGLRPRPIKETIHGEQEYAQALVKDLKGSHPNMDKVNEMLKNGKDFDIAMD